jgi:AcrR family transcriptional regulator
MTNRKRRAGGAKRTAVLGAVTEVLADRGYENTRFSDVSVASGVAISTLQNYFGSREDMVIEALGLSTDREVSALEAVAAAEDDPWDRLVAMIDRSLRTSDTDRRMLVEFWRSAARDKELHEYSMEVQRRYRAPYLAAVNQGREQGLFAPTDSPDDVTDFLLVTLAGVIVSTTWGDFTLKAGFRDLLLSQLRVVLGSVKGK